MEDEKKTNEPEDVYLFNCTQLRGTFPKKIWLNSVLFIDGRENEAERMAEKVGMKTFKVIQAFESTSIPKYTVKTAEYNKKEDDLFNIAMFKCIQTMMIYGYSDYEKFSQKTIAKILGGIPYYND